MFLSGLEIGDRVALNEEKATVCYIGEVPPTKGEWLGVEWDNPSRGKHNGSKDGIQYFKCNHLTGGSFIRESKVSSGMSFLKAVKKRYIDDNIEEFETVSFQTKKVELVGCDSKHDLNSLKSISLLNCNVSSAGNPGEISSVLSNVTTVNLNGTLMSSWEDISLIIEQLPELLEIDLSRTRLRFKGSLNFSASKKLKTVILNDCSLNWKQVVKVCSMWPNAKLLGLSHNKINNFDEPNQENFLSSLESLQINSNPIGQWKKIKFLNNFPNLSDLQVNNCGFENLDVEELDLLSLKTLSLNDNNFKCLSVFNELNKLSNFENLYFIRNKTELKKDKSELTEILISKISKLKRLNNQEITSQLRLDSEISYLKAFGLEWRNSGGHQDPNKNYPNQNFLSSHPRYMQLLITHGAPQDVQIFKQTTALKGNLIEINLVNSFIPGSKPFVRKLPKSMKISRLKLMVEKLMKISDIKNYSLVYISKVDKKFVVELDRDSLTLHDVSIQPGDYIELRKSSLRDV